MLTSSPASLASTWEGQGLRSDLLPGRGRAGGTGLPAGAASASQLLRPRSPADRAGAALPGKAGDPSTSAFLGDA